MARKRVLSKNPRVLLVATCLLVAGLSACWGGGGTPIPPNENGSASVNFTTIISASGAPKCTVNTTYTYQPITTKATSEGSDAVQTHQRSDEVNSSTGTCSFQDGAWNLKQGKWRLSSSAIGSCDVELHSGINVVILKNGSCG